MFSCVVAVQQKGQYGNAHVSSQQDHRPMGGIVSGCDDQSVLGRSTAHLLVRHENTNATWYLRPQSVQPPRDALQKRIQQTQRTFSRYAVTRRKGNLHRPLCKTGIVWRSTKIKG